MVGQCQNNTLAGIENLVCLYDWHTCNLLIHVWIAGILEIICRYKFFNLYRQIKKYYFLYTRLNNSVFLGRQYKSYLSVMQVQYCIGDRYTNHTGCWYGFFMMHSMHTVGPQIGEIE